MGLWWRRRESNHTPSNANPIADNEVTGFQKSDVPKKCPSTISPCENPINTNENSNLIAEAILAIDRLPISDSVKANLITKLTGEITND